MPHFNLNKVYTIKRVVDAKSGANANHNDDPFGFRN